MKVIVDAMVAQAMKFKTGISYRQQVLSVYKDARRSAIGAAGVWVDVRYALMRCAELKTVSARRAVVVELMAAMESDGRVVAVQQAIAAIGVNATASNALRSMLVTLKVLATTYKFAEWDEAAGWVLNDADTAERIRRFIQVAHAHVKATRKVIATMSAARLPAVAVPKQERKAKVREYIVAHTARSVDGLVQYSNPALYVFMKAVRDKQLIKSYGFTMSYKIWARALVIRSLFPSGAC